MSEQKIWSPKLSKRQADAINDISLKKRKLVLLHGGKLSGKTRGILHLVCKHMWSNDRARVLIFAKTVKSASIAGSYKELTDDVLPEWLNGGFGMKLTKDPSTDGATRTSHFKTSNYYGTDSECYLFSVAREKEVEEKVKNIKGSMIYFIELSNFTDRIVMDATISQLRSDTVPEENRLWIADTNPPEDGEDSWIHDIFFKRDTTGMDEEAAKIITEGVAEYLFTAEHNPFVTSREFALLRAQYAHSKDLTDRYIKGLWVKDTAKGHFSKVFIEEQHVVGYVTPTQQEIIMPSEHCIELITGLDPGDVWMSWTIMEKVMTDRGPVYCVLDELYNDGEQISLKEFTEVFMDKMDKYEEYVMQKYSRKLMWRHWADNAANNNYKAATGSYDSNVVYQASNGRIRLLSAPKGTGSVKRRVHITQVLFHEGRLFLSANCTGAIDMIRNLRKGKGALHYVPRNKYKHRFDSFSYILDAEEPVEVQKSFAPKAERGKVISM